MFRNYLIGNGISSDRIVAFAFDTDDVVDLLDAYFPEEPTKIYDKNKKTFVINSKKFRAYIKECTSEGGEYYLLLDEIQLLDNFVGTLNGFLRNENFDTYVIGSNSQMLSSDILTEFRGRGDQIQISPLSFSEYYAAVGLDFESAYEEYSYYGGMPYLFNLSDENEKSEYLNRLFYEVYIKDLIERNGIADADSFTRLIEVIASAVGSLTNPTKLENTFKSKQISYSHNTIKKHIDYLKDAFLVKEAVRYDIKGKQYIGANSKLYFTDIGLRNAMLGFRQIEPTHIMENIIYNELVNRGMSVDVGVVEISEKNANGNNVRKQLEVDFVCNSGRNRYYIQSAYMLPDRQKLEQENRPLKNIPDSFKKVIITKDRTKPWKTEEGILVISMKDFLTDAESING